LARTLFILNDPSGARYSAWKVRGAPWVSSALVLDRGGLRLPRRFQRHRNIADAERCSGGDSLGKPTDQREAATQPDQFAADCSESQLRRGLSRHYATIPPGGGRVPPRVPSRGMRKGPHPYPWPSRPRSRIHRCALPGCNHTTMVVWFCYAERESSRKARRHGGC
jgi:hypothetical protein